MRYSRGNEAVWGLGPGSVNNLGQNCTRLHPRARSLPFPPAGMKAKEQGWDSSGVGEPAPGHTKGLRARELGMGKPELSTAGPKPSPATL